MDPQRPITHDCPYCVSPMTVSAMTCSNCAIKIEAQFPMSRLASLPIEHQRFIEMFVLSGGNLKEIAEQVNVSYPTIRSRLDKVIEALRTEIGKTRRIKGNLLDAVDQTQQTSAEEAAKLIKGI